MEHRAESDLVSDGGNTTRPLRFGVMVPGPEIAWWQAETIRRITNAGVALAKLVIVDRTAPPPRSRGLVHRETAWNAYQRMFVRGKIAASRAEPWQPIAAGAEIIEVAAERRGRYSEYFKEADVQRVQKHDLDFILRFGFNIIRGEILRTPRYGVWSFHHGDLFEVRGQPACFWEIYRDLSVTGITLQRLTDALDAGVVLGMRHIATTRKSYVRTRDTAFRAGVGMVEQACKAIQRGDLAAALGAEARTVAPVDRAPNWTQVAAFAVKLSTRRVVEAARWLMTHDQWNVGVVDVSAEDVAAGQIPEPRWLPHPKRGEFLADPFAARTGDELVVLAEHMTERENVGRLRSIRLNGSGDVTNVTEPIRADVHLSYPYLLRADGRWLCVPEMAEAGEVGVWEASDSMREWRRVATILSGVALLDPTLFHHEGRWWLLGAVRGEGRTDELHAWYATSLGGPWTAHVGNPLKVDARSTRPAGTVFRHGGRLFRPAQDCSRTYGGAIAINRIDEISPSGFSETMAARISCGRRWAYSRGIHTISQADEGTFVVDAKRTRLSLQSCIRQIGIRLGRREAADSREDRFGGARSVA